MRFSRIYDNLEEYLSYKKVVVLYGPRQVGKTNILKHYMQRQSYPVKYETGDDYRTHELWGSRRFDLLSEYIEGYNTVIIDEAQRIPEIGMSLKLLVDAEVDCRFIVTGPSSFELSGQVGEPLTGRKRQLLMYPISTIELHRQSNRYELKQRLEEILLFGSYPEVLTGETTQQKIEILNEITGSYLLKDILELENVKNAKVLLDLLRLLAFQVGSLVSLRELGAQLGLNYKTVARYIDLLEKSFVLFTVRGYSGNLRKEISKKSKYYFYDTGVRNSIISNHNPLHVRDDAGLLWENFLFMERMKRNTYSAFYPNTYFWRTWNQQEIDYIEETGGELHAFEFTWSKKIRKVPLSFKEAYPRSSFTVITPDNWLDFVL